MWVRSSRGATEIDVVVVPVKSRDRAIEGCGLGGKDRNGVVTDVELEIWRGNQVPFPNSAAVGRRAEASQPA